MNEKQQVQSRVAILIKLIQFERNRPTLTLSQLAELETNLTRALELLKSGS